MSGEDVLTMKWGKLRALRWAEASIVFQGALHSLNPVHRVEHQIAEPIRLHQPGLPDARVAERVTELLEQVGLPGARGRAYPHQLSGGQRQRVMIAMALACQPSLIIADEPTTALDVMVQAQVLDLLSGLVRDLGVGMMIISHDLSVLSDLCDRVVVMYAGRVVETGTAKQVFTDPKHPVHAGTLGRVPPHRRPRRPLRARRAGRRPARSPRATRRAARSRHGVREQPPCASRQNRRCSSSRAGGRPPASGWGSRDCCRLGSAAPR